MAETQPGRLSGATAPPGAAPASLPPVGIVVPTWHDDAALEALLPRLRALDPPPVDVLVVDGAASAATRARVESAGARWLASPPGRGTQLNRGARAVRGEVLWFVHADAGIAADSLAAIGRALVAGAAGGAFRFRFAGPPTATKRFLEHAIAWRCRHGVAYGDQGLFARREDFERAGGFAEAPLFEEVPLVRALRAGRRFALLEAPILVSPRRWEQDGYLRRTLYNRLLALGHAAGVSPQRLARWYRRART